MPWKSLEPDLVVPDLDQVAVAGVVPDQSGAAGPAPMLQVQGVLADREAAAEHQPGPVRPGGEALGQRRRVHRDEVAAAARRSQFSSIGSASSGASRATEHGSREVHREPHSATVVQPRAMTARQRSRRSVVGLGAPTEDGRRAHARRDGGRPGDRALGRRLAGVVAGLAGLGIAGLIGWLIGPVGNPVTAVGELIIELLPAPLVNFGKETLGFADKPILLAMIVAGRAAALRPRRTAGATAADGRRRRLRRASPCSASSESAPSPASPSRATCPRWPVWCSAT